MHIIFQNSSPEIYYREFQTNNVYLKQFDRNNIIGDYNNLKYQHNVNLYYTVITYTKCIYSSQYLSLHKLIHKSLYNVAK